MTKSNNEMVKKKFVNFNPWNKGKKTGPLSEEHKRKISKALIGKRNALGFKHSEEAKEKISESLKGNTRGFKKGQKPWDKGQHFSEEYRKKLSEAQKGEKSGGGEVGLQLLIKELEIVLNLLFGEIRFIKEIVIFAKNVDKGVFT